MSSEEEEEDWLDTEPTLCKSLFDLSVQIKRLLADRSSNPSMLESEKCVKLLKIDVTTFDRNILHWITFWEQFEVSIHSKTQLLNAEKLAYLRYALKGGLTNQVIKGLSQSADQYEEP